MISFENVSKFVLSDVSIHIPRGKSVGLIGASGAGKTTLMKLASGLLLPEKGRVRTLGQEPVSKRKRLGRSVGVLFTDVPLLIREDTVAGNFEVLRRIYQINKDDFAREYQELSERLGFADFQNRFIKELSLGQRRRAEIGAALLHRPQLLLLDEPTSGLDESGKQAFYEILAEREKEGMTMLLTSHNMAEISRVCDRIALLDKGCLVYYGGEEQLRKKFAPVDTMVLELEGSIPDLQDLPLMKYMVEGKKLHLFYNSNYVTAAEILELILSQSVVKEVKIQKSDLPDVILQMNEERIKENE